jgi:periplasmic protein TonB
MKAICSLCIAACLLSPLLGRGEEPSRAHDSAPIKVASGVMAELAVYHPIPVISPDAKLGTTVLSAHIDKTGRVEDLKVLTSKSQALSDAVAATVKRWRYRPYLLNGEPVDVQTTITINFNSGAATPGS